MSKWAKLNPVIPAEIIKPPCQNPNEPEFPTHRKSSYFKFATINFIQSVEESKGVVQGLESDEWPHPYSFELKDADFQPPEHKWLDDVQIGNISESPKHRVKQVLEKYRNAFALSPGETGCCKFFPTT